MSMSKRPGSQWRDMTTDHTRATKFSRFEPVPKTNRCLFHGDQMGKWYVGRPGKSPRRRCPLFFANGEDAFYRIHRANKPKSIGKVAFSGCIRLLNQDIAELYSRVPLGSKVIMISSGLN